MVTDRQRVLVYCANGFQGHAIIAELLRSGWRVRALVRDKARAAPLAAAGAEVCPADLDDAASLRKAHQDADVAVVQLPSGVAPDQTLIQAGNAMAAIRSSGITNVVLNSSVNFPSRSRELPQFAARQQAEQQVLGSSPQVSVIRAPFLLSNLLLPWASQSVAVRGVLAYPVAADVPLCWAAPEDVGQLVSLVIREQFYGHTLYAGARKALRGEELANAFSRALNRIIRYQAMPLDDFEAGVDAAISPGAGKQIGAIFRFIERHPDDRAFVSTPFRAPAGFPSFEPTGETEWVSAHADAFSQASVGRARASSPSLTAKPVPGQPPAAEAGRAWRERRLRFGARILTDERGR